MNRINLFSKEWCELVFAGKNKTYGAYRIRMESTKRHIKAMLIVFLVVGLMILVNGFFNKGSAQNTNMIVNVDGEHTLIDLYQEKDDDIPEPIVIDIPPLPIVESVKFLELVVVADNQLTEEDMILTQQALTESHGVIADVTHGGNTDGPGFVISDITEPILVDPVVTDKIVDYVDQMPTYPGGDTELMEFLQKNLVYPVVDQEMGTQGAVRVRFVVEKDGSIGTVDILRSLSPNCDKEAVRVIKKMPKWIPGKQNGVPVRVYYNLPVRFKLMN